MTFENYQLGTSRMLKYGQILTKERKKIRARALQLEHDSLKTQDEGLKEVSKLAIKADKGYFCRRSLKFPDRGYDFDESVAPRCRKRKKKRGSLRLVDKVDIVHQVLVEHEMVAEVAKEYRVSQ